MPAAHLGSFRQLKCEKWVLRAGPETIAREPQKTATVSRDKFCDALSVQLIAELVIRAEKIADEVVASLFRVWLDAELCEAVVQLMHREGVQLFHPQISGGKFRHNGTGIAVFIE